MSTTALPRAAAKDSPQPDHFKSLAVMSLLLQITATTLGRCCWPLPQLAIVTDAATAVRPTS